MSMWLSLKTWRTALRYTHRHTFQNQNDFYPFCDLSLSPLRHEHKTSSPNKPNSLSESLKILHLCDFGATCSLIFGAPRVRNRSALTSMWTSVCMLSTWTWCIPPWSRVAWNTSKCQNKCYMFRPWPLYLHKLASQDPYWGPAGCHRWPGWQQARAPSPQLHKVQHMGSGIMEEPRSVSVQTSDCSYLDLISDPVLDCLHLHCQHSADQQGGDRKHLRGSPHDRPQARQKVQLCQACHLHGLWNPRQRVDLPCFLSVVRQRGEEQQLTRATGSGLLIELVSTSVLRLCLPLAATLKWPACSTRWMYTFCLSSTSTAMSTPTRTWVAAFTRPNSSPCWPDHLLICCMHVWHNYFVHYGQL